MGAWAVFRVGLIPYNGRQAHRESDRAGIIIVVAARLSGAALPRQVSCFNHPARLTAEQTLAALTAALFAFLTPLPGGLGALEAGQVYVMTAFGHTAAIGIGISLLMRARDALNGGLGLLLAGVQSRKDRK